MADNKTQIAAMRKLGMTDAEIQEVLAADKAIDRGEKMEFDLDPEKEKIAKKFANVKEHKKPTVYDFQKRERKANPTKGAIIAELAQFLTETSENACENVVITNKERQISFTIGENTFELTLVQKRKPK